MTKVRPLTRRVRPGRRRGADCRGAACPREVRAALEARSVAEARADHDRQRHLVAAVRWVVPGGTGVWHRRSQRRAGQRSEPVLRERAGVGVVVQRQLVAWNTAEGGARCEHRRPGAGGSDGLGLADEQHRPERLQRSLRPERGPVWTVLGHWHRRSGLRLAVRVGPCDPGHDVAHRVTAPDRCLERAVDVPVVARRGDQQQLGDRVRRAREQRGGSPGDGRGLQVRHERDLLGDQRWAARRPSASTPPPASGTRSRVGRPPRPGASPASRTGSPEPARSPRRNPIAPSRASPRTSPRSPSGSGSRTTGITPAGDR